LASISAEKMSLFRSFGDSFGLGSRAVRGSFYSENPQGNFNSGATMSGHYVCFENLATNCGVSSAFFAILVIAAGAVIFGTYVVVSRRRESLVRDEDLPGERVSVDEEGWETKVAGEDDGWETKPES